jgi:hypothetical protein
MVVAQTGQPEASESVADGERDNAQHAADSSSAEAASYLNSIVTAQSPSDGGMHVRFVQPYDVVTDSREIKSTSMHTTAATATKSRWVV